VRRRLVKHTGVSWNEERGQRKHELVSYTTALETDFGRQFLIVPFVAVGQRTLWGEGVKE
jgi:hypothetical protein